MTRALAWLALFALLLVCPARAGAQVAPAPPSPAPPEHQHDGPSDAPPPRELPPFIPPPTDEDRRAAFPELEGHTVHDEAVHYFVLLDQIEWQGGADGGLNLDSKGWLGGDRNRLWFRGELETEEGSLGETQAHVLYGRQISRWWDIVAGVRQDFRPGDPQTWAAVGIQGLAPYWFEVEATAYAGASGRTQVRLEVEYELLLTNRAILQPLLEVQIAGKSDPERSVGAGLSATDFGFRLRYEFKRELAPYVGVIWRNKWGRTAALAEAAGEDGDGARLVTGLRLWF